MIKNGCNVFAIKYNLLRLHYESECDSSGQYAEQKRILKIDCCFWRCRYFWKTEVYLKDIVIELAKAWENVMLELEMDFKSLGVNF